ncbi:MAG: hypothetical protein A2X13_08035 [Bacteroidetes bacterium GWC2_33_15]|nr:MAG: hypothetical protein A2X10_05090 [Bacteroidetes bacterium GWA2_33_15]OFX52692.1 MAG: hypothetical protein A2X13_08035 [Bacteroidetes bacterium GWC2_33_15]OFX64002.1 MAG: hypothetical protein A2X15_02300 [Bacteroidetes bacterium GWB2_32_14]OFX67313.1 MAG: hypothetical protein A2X14_12115 [Bacteroidetes bacterium GWD2_33_33]HAN18820.1 hypothetical protein [Bacteroidales bacterium]
MKLYYPYFNLFYKAGTSDYRLDALVKVPGNCILDAIDQAFVIDYWEVRIKLKENTSLPGSITEQTMEFAIPLTPADVNQLEKIKIIVKNYDNLLKNGTPDGEGDTGKDKGELE